MYFACLCSVLSKEYQDASNWISIVVQKHKDTLVPGMPQLNMCDMAVMVSFTLLLENFYFQTNILSFSIFVRIFKKIAVFKVLSGCFFFTDFKTGNCLSLYLIM